MAEAVVTKKEVIESVTLTLNAREAQTLMNILGALPGHSEYWAMYSALHAKGFKSTAKGGLIRLEGEFLPKEGA